MPPTLDRNAPAYAPKDELTEQTVFALSHLRLKNDRNSTRLFEPEGFAFTLHGYPILIQLALIDLPAAITFTWLPSAYSSMPSLATDTTLACPAFTITVAVA